MNEVKVSLFDIAMSLSNVVDLVSPELDGHHKRVAYTAYRIAKNMGLPLEDISNIFLAGLLHDAGTMSFEERISSLQFEAKEGNAYFTHPEVGYYLVKSFKPFENAANIIRWHHIPWEGSGSIEFCQRPPVESNILYLADRVDILMNRKEIIPAQIANIREIMKRRSGRIFMSEAVDTFLSISEDMDFWRDTLNAKKRNFKDIELVHIDLDMEGILAVTKIFEKIVDFRSRFTSTHSSGVSSVAREISRAAGFNDFELNMMRVAGYLHDIGKLAVPAELLEKEGKLTKEEYMIVKKHAYYSYNVLKDIENFETINKYGSLHHERLDGSGYPFGLRDSKIPLGSRIMAVADVFTAITEDRPYRKGMNYNEVLKVMNNMAEYNKLDKDVVDILKSNFDKIEEIRIKAQHEAAEEYGKFTEYRLIQGL